MYRIVRYLKLQKIKKKFLFISLIFIASILSISCSEDESNTQNGNDPTPPQSCSGQSDCSDGYACVSVAGVSYCQLTCSLSSDACGASASCGSVGATSVSVCQPEEESTDSNSGNASTEESAPQPDKQPKLPCSTDADCAQFDESAICAEFQGTKDCTIPCTEERECDVPAIGGFSVDFLTCLPDESDQSRSACLPDEACFSNPLNCVTLPNANDFGDGFPMDSFGDGDEDPSDGFDF